MRIEEIREEIIKQKADILKDYIELLSIPAINPRVGGLGEYKRVRWLEDYFDRLGIAYEEYRVADDAVAEGQRYSLVVRFSGSEHTNKTLWFIAHLDTVNSGDESAWYTDPLKPAEKDGKVFGLGAEDNGQALICNIYTCRYMHKHHLRAKCHVAFLFVSDEEVGNRYGLEYLIKNNLFSPDDEAVIPDSGSRDGTFIEVAEKSALWLKFTVTGTQTHAAMPQTGINASYIGSRFAVDLVDKLREAATQRNILFNPPYSTVELTQKFNNVDSPNVVPGKDVFVLDMRLLPCFTNDQALKLVDSLLVSYEYRYRVTITYEELLRSDAPDATSPDSLVATNLVQVLKELGIEAYCGGIGGGTCAAMLRRQHIPAVVWATVDDLAHQANEYAVFDNIIQDISVFISLVNRYVE